MIKGGRWSRKQGNEKCKAEEKWGGPVENKTCLPKYTNYHALNALKITSM